MKLYKNNQFIYDNYYNGRTWEISARHLLKDYTTNTDLKIKFLPLQPNDFIYIAGKVWKDQGHKENVLNINSITIHPIYNKHLDTNNSTKGQGL